MIFTRSLAIAAAASAVLSAGAARAATWTVDPAHSKLGFKFSVEGATYEGTFKAWSAQISFDPKALATSKAVVTVDLTKEVSNNKDADGSLPTDEWFDVKRHAQAVFTTTRFVDRGGDRYEADGDLTLKGVKRPVALPFTLTITNGVAHMLGSATLDRTAFNVGSGRWSTADEVAKAVTVTVDLTARQAR